MTATNDILKESFGTVGKKYGYDNVEAEFAAWRDFKVKWQRTYRWADFKVSDYLSDAPAEVLSALAETLFRKISGQEATYSEEMKEYVTAPSFVKEKQPMYLRRTKKITRDHIGAFKDLHESFSRLEKMGLVSRDKDIFFTWTKENLFRNVGYCSSLMKVMVISSTFDDDIIPDFVLDFVVYHEYLVMTEGKKNFGREHDYDLDQLERKFPEREEALKWISKMNLYI